MQQITNNKTDNFKGKNRFNINFFDGQDQEKLQVTNANESWAILKQPDMFDKMGSIIATH